MMDDQNMGGNTMGHDHGTDTHTMTCPAEGCGHEMRTHAHDEDEAVMKFMEMGKNHMTEAHPQMPPIDQDSMVAMIKANMKTM